MCRKLEDWIGPIIILYSAIYGGIVFYYLLNSENKLGDIVFGTVLLFDLFMNFGLTNTKYVLFNRNNSENNKMPADIEADDELDRKIEKSKFIAGYLAALWTAYALFVDIVMPVLCYTGNINIEGMIFRLVLIPAILVDMALIYYFITECNMTDLKFVFSSWFEGFKETLTSPFIYLYDTMRKCRNNAEYSTI